MSKSAMSTRCRGLTSTSSSTTQQTIAERSQDSGETAQDEIEVVDERHAYRLVLRPLFDRRATADSRLMLDASCPSLFRRCYAPYTRP